MRGNVPEPPSDLIPFVNPLLGWFRENARVLPFRSKPTPYRVWISEIMLQQTRVEAVKPYYERFLRELPTVSDLAAVEEERLLKLWEGLGYYSRARNLKKAAQMVEEVFGGEIPAQPEEIRRLPGIGDYTAGAILSIAFGLPVPAVDGNVLRVVSRCLDRAWDISRPETKRAVRDAVEKAIPRECPGDFNQALMELGALVCLPNGAPKCGECPLKSLCAGFQKGTAPSLPRKPEKKPRRAEERTVFLLFCGERTAVQKRPEKGLLAGLFELPYAQGSLSEPEALDFLTRRCGVRPEDICREPDSSHIFSHLEWHMTAYSARLPLPSGEGLFWASAQDLREAYALPSAFRVYSRRILSLLEGEKT